MAEEAKIKLQTLPTTVHGSQYASALLKKNKRYAYYAFLFQGPKTPDSLRLVTLKVGKFDLDEFGLPLIKEKPVRKGVYQMVHLQAGPLQKLCNLLSENLEPLQQDKKHFIEVSGDEADAAVGALKSILANRSHSEFLALVDEHDLLPEDVRHAVIAKYRAQAISEYEKALDDDRDEHFWQKWFQANDWVLGSDFVTILNERSIDLNNEGDYLVKAMDGFLDIIEIKRPNKHFWHKDLDHDNYVPHLDLTKAITQGLNYMYHLEEEMNSGKRMKDFNYVPIAKPRAVLIHGRSHDWCHEQLLGQRLLNAALTGIQVLTYDQVLQRAKRTLGDKD